MTTALVTPSYEQAQLYIHEHDLGVQVTTLLTHTRFVPTGLVLHAEDIVFVEGWKGGEHAAYIEEWLRLVLSNHDERIEDCRGWTGPAAPEADSVRLTDVKRLTLQPDDTIVLRLAAPADAAISSHIEQHMRTVFPDHHCIVLSPGAELELIAKPDVPDFAGWAAAETLEGAHSGDDVGR